MIFCGLFHLWGGFVLAVQLRVLLSVSRGVFGLLLLLSDTPKIWVNSTCMISVRVSSKQIFLTFYPVFPFPVSSCTFVFSAQFTARTVKSCPIRHLQKKSSLNLLKTADYWWSAQINLNSKQSNDSIICDSDVKSLRTWELLSQRHQNACHLSHLKGFKFLLQSTAQNQPQRHLLEQTLFTTKNTCTYLHLWSHHHSQGCHDIWSCLWLLDGK